MRCGKKEVNNLKSFKKLSYIIWGISLSIVLLLVSVNIVAFNLNHYKKSFTKYNTAEITGLDSEGLEYIIKDVLEYLKDDREKLDTEAVIKGKKREVFGNREISHMADVKKLFTKGRVLCIVSLMLFLMTNLFIVKTNRHWKKAIPSVLLYITAINISFLFILLLLIRIDFNKYFVYFHNIFFNNDLWKLDPNTSLLILMVPEGFFFDTTVRIIYYFVILLIVSGLLGFIGQE